MTGARHGSVGSEPLSTAIDTGMLCATRCVCSAANTSQGSGIAAVVRTQRPVCSISPN